MSDEPSNEDGIYPFAIAKASQAAHFCLAAYAGVAGTGHGIWPGAGQAGERRALRQGRTPPPRGCAASVRPGQQIQAEQQHHEAGQQLEPAAFVFL